MASVWLFGGEFYCDHHRPGNTIPFFFAPENAACVVCGVALGDDNSSRCTGLKMPSVSAEGGK